MEETMIIPLESVTATQIASRLVQVREEGGVVALGRVLTLIVMTDHDAHHHGRTRNA